MLEKDVWTEFCRGGEESQIKTRQMTSMKRNRYSHQCDTQMNLCAHKTQLCPPEVHYLQQEVPRSHFLWLPGTMAIVGDCATLIRRDLTSTSEPTINPPPLNGTSDDRLTRHWRRTCRKTAPWLKMVKCVTLGPKEWKDYILFLDHVFYCVYLKLLHCWWCFQSKPAVKSL